jgi:hypothetical protein
MTWSPVAGFVRSKGDKAGFFIDGRDTVSAVFTAFGAGVTAGAAAAAAW